MSLNYVTHERTVIPRKVLSDPYCRVEVEQIDHQYTQWYHLNGWNRSRSCITGYWEEGLYVGLSSTSSYTSVDLTKNIIITEEGFYRIRVKARRGPDCNGKKVRIYIDNELIDEPLEAYYGNYHWTMHDAGLVYLNTGTRAFKINAEKPILVSEIIIHKINTHSNKNLTDYSKKLDIQSLKFTKNSVNELNTFEMPITLKEEYYDEDSPSRFIFDGYTNSITAFMGETASQAEPVFGGYIVGLTDNENTLTIKGADRLLDFYREPLLLNFEINTNVRSDTNKSFPFIRKNNVYEAVRYIGENNELWINCSGLDAPTKFYWDFISTYQFNVIPISGFTKMHDKRAGNPKPCLRLGVGKRTGRATLTLFKSHENPFDANIDNIFSFDYMFSSTSAKYPTEFHIELDMYKEGETPADAVTYNILFNSKEGSNNVIGSFKPAYNNKWNTAKIDLRNAFDNYAPSSEYNVIEMRLADTISTTQVVNRLNSAIWLDNITVYDENKNIKATIDQEGSYPFEFLQKICEESEHSLWVDYGSERRKDVLVLKSDYDDISPIAALSSNTIEIGEVTYNLRDHNVRNIARRMYHQTVNKQTKIAHTVKKMPKNQKYAKKWITGHTKTGKPIYNYLYYTTKNNKLDVNFIEDEGVWSSYKRYLGWSDFKNLTDTTKKVDAERDAHTFLNEHNIAPFGFTLTMRGTAKLDPNQYLLVEADKRRLSGLHKIKTITHEYNYKNADKWKTMVDLGIPSARFMKMAMNIKKAINRLNSKDERTIYNTQQVNNLGITSPGAFI